MKRRTWIGAGIALAAAGAGAGFALRRRDMDRDRGAAETTFWQMVLERPDGGSIAMARLQGRPLLLNFWATWCAPCIQEMPLLDRFHREQHARGWQVLGLAIDSAEPVREFLGKLPIGFPVVLGGLRGVELTRGLGNKDANLPFSVVFDRSGHVIDTKLGAVDAQKLERWRQLMG
jgi:thiol-disulfide isomerase/thioredoxin